MAGRKSTPHSKCNVIAFSTVFFMIWLWFQLFCIGHVHGVSNPQWTRENQFCYDPNRDCGPPSWEGTCRTGQHQSPIDIHAPKVSLYKKWTFLTFNPAYISSQPAFYAINNGHSFQMQFEEGMNANSELTFEGGGLNREYRFAQLHFHWGSEHTINGLRYPLELHIVHYSTKYSSLMDAMRADSDPSALAVFAVFFQIGPNNPALDSLVGVARRSTDPGKDYTFYQNHPINVQHLLPRKLTFVRYHGSLTTPPCTENVVWTVFNHPVAVSLEQLRSFQGVKNDEDLLFMNFRPTQPHNGRSIKLFGVVPLALRRIDAGNAFISFPRPWSGLAQVFGKVVQLIRSLLSGNGWLKGLWGRSLENVHRLLFSSPFSPPGGGHSHLI